MSEWVGGLGVDLWDGLMGVEGELNLWWACVGGG